MEEKLEEIRELHRIHGHEDYWTFDSYTKGIYNGLEMALAILEDRDPEFKTSSN